MFSKTCSQKVPVWTQHLNLKILQMLGCVGRGDPQRIQLQCLSLLHLHSITSPFCPLLTPQSLGTVECLPVLQQPGLCTCCSYCLKLLLLLQSKSYLIFKALVKWYLFLWNLLKMKLTSLLLLPPDDDGAVLLFGRNFCRLCVWIFPLFFYCLIVLAPTTLFFSFCKWFNYYIE